MADAFRENGLVAADDALTALVEDPQRLHRARARFSESPPSYRSFVSHNSTRSQSPELQSDEQRRHEKRKWKLIRERRASFPSNQFKAQKSEEIDRLYQEDGSRTSRHPAGTDFYKLAEENVKKRWVEQGIWNEKWETKNVWRWKHEEPLDSEFESNKDKAARAETRLFCPPLEQRGSKPRRSKSAEELRTIEECRRIRELEREASRPYYQFAYQVSKERERIQEEMSLPETLNFSDLNQMHPNRQQAALQARAERGHTPTEPNVQNSIVSTPPDINTRAYERVKNTWVRRGIWNKKWGILPGMSWKHEQSIEEMLREEMGNDSVPPEVGAVEDRRGPSEVPCRPLFGAYPGEQVTSSFSCSVFNNIHEPATLRAGAERIACPLPAAADGHIDDPLQEACPGSDPVRLSNGDPSLPSIASCSERYQAKRREAGRSVLLSGARRGEREVSVEAGLAPELPRTALGPAVRPSKISKAYRRNRTSPRRQPDGSEMTEVLKLVSVSDIASDPLVDSSVQPRRSRRLQEARRITDADSSVGRISTSSPKSAKPHGVVQRRSRTIRQRTG
ncbi:hypothetical protein UVI_02025760 [Ustilaginoidea virens]|uniref:Uncharacterized protein n=1 Tax=Ustilaginoidea virens TaxID=1159556 RepID=A0A1B5KRE6_USTVR|nr:hypothetical protein UVI_02025760 [Ustilaginoidea virens]